MLTWRYCVCLVLLGAFTARSEIVLMDDFSYADGALQEVASGRWTGHSGATKPMMVVNGAVELSQSKTQDANALLGGQPYSAAEGSDPVLFAAFSMTVGQLPSAEGTYFAHFKDRLSGFRGRVWLMQNGAAPESYRVGISSGSGSAPEQVLQRDLQVGHSYRVVLKLRISDGVATLWVDPVTGEEAAVSSDPSSPIAVTAFALRQATGMGRLTIDDLVVATSFADVVDQDAPPPDDAASGSEPDTGSSEPPPVAGDGSSTDKPDDSGVPPPDDEPPPASNPPVITAMPRSQTVAAGGTASFSISASGTEPLQIQWRFNGANVAGATNAVLELSNVTAAQQGEYRAFVANRFGTATSPGAYLTVTNPPPPMAVVVSIRFTASAEPRLEWKAEPDRAYAVFYADSVAGPYRALAGELHFSTGAGQFVDADLGRGEARFYRVTAK